MEPRDLAYLAAALRPRVHWLAGEGGDYDPLLDLVGDARFVLIGEASHGTSEFYRQRALITQRLIVERGFSAVAVEADWPYAERVNCFVRSAGDDATADEALGDFTHFPRWMWRNADVRTFVAWLRAHNDALPAGAPKVGFYGIDLYSLYRSIEAVLSYLDQTHPEAAREARRRYACLEQFADPQQYGYAVNTGAVDPCTDEALAQLLELQRQTAVAGRRAGTAEDDAHFFAEQNARLITNAEAYYRSMFRGREAWNLRDTHMAETVDALAAHLGRRGQPAKIVVWAHNSHLGDARATELGERGELNLGQLLRERYGPEVVNVGFSTYTGTVRAATDWDEPGKLVQVRPALPGSYEALFHAVAAGGERAVGEAQASERARGDFLLLLRSEPGEQLRAPRLERAIGVVYRPQTERWSHYFEARLAEQFDAVIHLDTTRAVAPLDADSGEPGEEPGAGLID
jgi:erythromycin esterase-like protein